MKLKLTGWIAEGTRMPRGFGLAYMDCLRCRGRIAVLPLNYFLRAWRTVQFRYWRVVTKQAWVDRQIVAESERRAKVMAETRATPEIIIPKHATLVCDTCHHMAPFVRWTVGLPANEIACPWCCRRFRVLVDRRIDRQAIVFVVPGQSMLVVDDRCRFRIEEVK